MLTRYIRRNGTKHKQVPCAPTLFRDFDYFVGMLGSTAIRRETCLYPRNALTEEN